MECIYCHKSVDEIKKDKRIDGRWNNEKIMKKHDSFCREKKIYFKELYDKHIKEIENKVYLCFMSRDVWDELSSYFDFPHISNIDKFITNKSFSDDKPFLIFNTSESFISNELYWGESYLYEDVIDYYVLVQLDGLEDYFIREKRR